MNTEAGIVKNSKIKIYKKFIFIRKFKYCITTV